MSPGGSPLVALPSLPSINSGWAQEKMLAVSSNSQQASPAYWMTLQCDAATAVWHFEEIWRGEKNMGHACNQIWAGSGLRNRTAVELSYLWPQSRPLYHVSEWLSKSHVIQGSVAPWETNVKDTESDVSTTLDSATLKQQKLKKFWKDQITNWWFCLVTNKNVFKKWNPRHIGTFVSLLLIYYSFAFRVGFKTVALCKWF